MHPTEHAARPGHDEAAPLARVFGRSIVLSHPERLVFPPSWIEHIPFAFWLMDVLRPRVFVELGTHSGNSYAALAQSAEQLSLSATGYAVDTWKGDQQAGLYNEAVFEEWRAYHDQRYASFSTLIRSTFDEAVQHFADRSIDLLHLDGYHTLEAVSHDVATWLPKMSSRGVMLLHDTNVRVGDFGAWRVWETLRERYPTFEFLHGYGLGVLVVGTDVPPDLVWLTDLQRQATITPKPLSSVRESFARLGATLLARYELNVAEGTVTALQQNLSASESSVANLTSALDSARARLAILDERVASAEREARASQDKARALDEDVAGLSERLKRASGANARYASLSHASARSLAAVSAQLGSLRARTRTLAWMASTATTTPAGRLGRAVTTMRALGVTPRRLAARPGNLGRLVRLAIDPRNVRDAHLIANSGLFDPQYYLEREADVRGSGAAPLAHFVMAGGREGRSPHPLFDAAWYLERYGDVKATGANPLAHYLRTASHEAREPNALFSSVHYRTQVGGALAVTPLQHYVRHGALEGRSPHPLFDPEYYVESYGTAIDGADPFAHFLQTGAAAGFNPHPLFDSQFYRQQLRTDQGLRNPLLHYLQSSPQRHKPHPLFDPGFYARSYKDVVASGVDPLTHFVTIGGAEGRRPIVAFDSEWYLSTYEDVARSGVNPLVHFVRNGWREWRNPSPQFDTAGYLSRYADVAGSGANPLVHYVERGSVEGRNAAPIEADPTHDSDRHRIRLSTSNLDNTGRVNGAIVCLSHVVPFPPRAGNEYRIHRMLRWLRDSGYIVIPIIAPNDGTRLSAADLRTLADQYGNVVFSPADGQLEYILRDVPDVLQSLDGESVPSCADLLQEDGVTAADERALLAMDRSFCTDTLIATVLRLQSALGPYVLLAEYIWMSRILPLVAKRAFKVIDTIDVFSTRGDKVKRYGVDDLTIGTSDERVRLERADLLVAIQENERQIIGEIAPDAPILTAGVDFDILSETGAPDGQRVLCVASGNPMNRRGVRDFLRFCWPKVHERVPTAELLVVGAVSDSLPTVPPGVRLLGKVADLRPLYESCRVAINPAVAGTGVKIKTLEALAHLRPIVTWPNGIDGVSRELAELCMVASDWQSFANRVVDTLVDPRPSWFSDRERDTARREGSAAHVYAALGDEIRQFFARV